MLPALAIAVGGAARAGATALNLVGSANDVLRKATPTVEDEVTVEVAGQPGCNKQRLYFLALAAANGAVRRLADLDSPLTPGYGLLMIEYDAANDWVRCTLKYRWSMATVNVKTKKNPDGSEFYRKMAVYRGPQCDVVGGTFDFVGSRGGPGFRGIPESSTDPNVPKLPFEGQPILTSCPTVKEPIPRSIFVDPAPTAPLSPLGAIIPSPNPKPPGDNRSRGAVQVPPGVGDILTPDPGGGGIGGIGGKKGKCCDKIDALIPLVFAALSPAGTSTEMVFKTPTPGPTGG